MINIVLFMGDKPSKKNEDPLVAFKGTKSGLTLAKWQNMLNLKNYYTTNQIYWDNNQLLSMIGTLNVPIIALGNIASRRLRLIGIKHFKLPHPSGRNRQINNKE